MSYLCSVRRCREKKNESQNVRMEVVSSISLVSKVRKCIFQWHILWKMLKCNLHFLPFLFTFLLVSFTQLKSHLVITPFYSPHDQAKENLITINPTLCGWTLLIPLLLCSSLSCFRWPATPTISSSGGSILAGVAVLSFWFEENVSWWCSFPFCLVSVCVWILLHVTLEEMKNKDGWLVAEWSSWGRILWQGNFNPLAFSLSARS